MKNSFDECSSHPPPRPTPSKHNKNNKRIATATKKKIALQNWRIPRWSVPAVTVG